MLGDTGLFLTALAWAASLYGAAAAVAGIYRHDPRWLESSSRALHGAAALLAGAVVILALAFLTDDFRIAYVAQHASRAQPLYLKLSAIWAGQEGSLLLWSAMQAGFAALALRSGNLHKAALIPWATVILALIGAFFCGTTLLFSNPFAALPQAPLDGQGMNPVLRHPGMVLHPPALYVGYVGLAVPFAFALASLIVRLSAAPGAQRLRQAAGTWPRTVHGWLLAAWLGLSLGLLLGMRWAYDVLGWGGYWGWDPVENAGLMPWLTLTALLHGAVMQDEAGSGEQGRGFRLWNVLLAILSFVLVLFGTFATRSGLIQSVHAYTVSNLGGVFLAAIVVSLAAGMALLALALRRERRTAPPSESAPQTATQTAAPLFSREGMFFLTLLLFLTLTVSVFVGSTLPTLTQWLAGRSYEAGPEWFDRVTGPQFAALVLLLGVCPVLGRGAAVARQGGAWARLIVWLGAAGAAVAAGLGALAGFGKPLSLVGFAFVGLAATTLALEFGLAATRRMRERSETLPVALWGLLRGQGRRYAGYLVHLGVILMAIGVIGTRMYQIEREVAVAPGEPVAVGPYVLTVDQLFQDLAEDRISTWAEVSVATGRGNLVRLAPRADRYAGFSQSYSTTALYSTLRDDLMVVLAGWAGDGSSATLKVVVNPLVSFLWLGGLVFLAGGALAFWPNSAQGIWNIVAPLLLAMLLAASAWAMWGAPHGVLRDAGVGAGGRPRVGQPAPDFSVPIAGADALTLDAVRGDVIVLNFWAPWCPTCKEDLPMLQSVWEDYRDRGVRFVGISFQADDAAIAESVATYGLTYPVGLDAPGEIAVRYGITGVPETFIIDAQGLVAFVNVGPLSEARLRAGIDAALGAAP